MRLGAAMIHCIGDSHVSVFSGCDGLTPVWPAPGVQNLRGVRAYRLGPVLAHSVATPGHAARRRLLRVLRDVARGKRVLLVFGEIDCRCHVVKQARRRGRAIRAVAREVARRYVDFAAGLKRRGLEVGVFAATPTPARRIENGEFTTVGSVRERTQATLAFNGQVRELCEGRGIAFYSVYDEVVDGRGQQDRRFFRDDIHLSQAAVPLIMRELRGAGWVTAGQACTPYVDQARGTVKGAGSTAGSGLAAEVRAALIDRAALQCAASGWQRIAIFGAGRHTQRMSGEPWASRGLEIVAVLDDRAPRCSNGLVPRLLGAPVRRPRPLPAGLDAIVVSSDAHEEALAARAREVGRGRVPIVRIYDWNGDATALAAGLLRLEHGPE
jgi:hypothetical protein